jgi:RNA polymerase sigma-70 factor (ECF subfamily)
LPRDKQAVLQELLVLRCARGERQALEELIREWQDRLFYFLRRLVPTEEDAWDVLQQTWLRVLRGIRTLKEPDRLPVWLYQVARCAALSHLRSHYRDRSRVEEERDLSAVAATDESDEFDNWEQVHTSLGHLSLAHREVLTLHFLEDFSVEQMADILDVPPGTIKSRLHYAKRALKAAIEKEPAHGRD